MLLFLQTLLWGSTNARMDYWTGLLELTTGMTFTSIFLTTKINKLVAPTHSLCVPAGGRMAFAEAEAAKFDSGHLTISTKYSELVIFDQSGSSAL